VVQRNTLVKRHINISLVHLQFIQCIVGFGLSPARQNIKCSMGHGARLIYSRLHAALATIKGGAAPAGNNLLL
jgi:hypothetical protein